jgi:manganese efflux pump family protein
VSIGVGVRGVSTAAKIRIGAAFASAEIAMNCVGAALGALVGHFIGDAAGYLGFVGLTGVGTYMLVESARGEKDRDRLDVGSGWALFVASLAISLDSLGVGFSLLYVDVPFAAALATIGVVSICATASGLALGRVLGARIETAAETLGGALLTLTGLAFIALKALHVG